ncbi:MAG: hypothetical protein OEU50_18480 [Gammaproteobacteria bacterium]|nr:hypothetical protein [Gammaproteobacteria bacterium]
MLTLYATPESLYCAKLRILLRHKQVRWQEIEPEVRALFPQVGSPRRA